MEKSILVSVIIRTCNRPDVLKNALNSIKMQSYKNIEVIIVEDGKNTAEAMIKEEFSDLNIKYKATQKKSGRTVVGNIGLEMAEGDYFNFLDDDDILYQNHIEVLLKTVKEKSVDAAYGIAEESQVVKISDSPYKIKEKRKIIRYRQPYNKLLLYSFNYLPIQSVLFNRKLYDECGGFDESLDILEDWDLWVRYSTVGNFIFVPQVTSKYYVPFRGKKKKIRGRQFDAALMKVYSKFDKYRIESNIGDFHKEMDYVINVYNQKTLIYYLKMAWNFIFYGDR